MPKKQTENQPEKRS
ncbi:hypothetical protein F383_11983 [Gossypium arboreum]|uniref:Uncharacterized protein n=1 Tax=Gossypium arboreum TaxID=29729 RepID=A0A0B0Q1U2_GOSAR|nr:hypothetical protein F383_11983 [Gossypium arboreum]